MHPKVSNSNRDKNSRCLLLICPVLGWNYLVSVAGGRGGWYYVELIEVCVSWLGPTIISKNVGLLPVKTMI